MLDKKNKGMTTYIDKYQKENTFIGKVSKKLFNVSFVVTTVFLYYNCYRYRLTKVSDYIWVMIYMKFYNLENQFS